MTNVLFVCSGNRDRSPTAEQLFQDVPGWDVKSAGTWPDAETKVTKEMLDWADRIFVMERHYLDSVVKMCPSCISKTAVARARAPKTMNGLQIVTTSQPLQRKKKRLYYPYWEETCALE